MLKKILMALGVVLVAIVAVFVGMLFWAHRAGTALEEKFFAALKSGQPDQLIAMMNPALQAEVDPPVLAAWMKMVHDTLGGEKGPSGSDFSNSAHYGSGGTRIESRGTVEFEKGTAQVDLVSVDDQLVRMSLQSPQFQADWFKGSASTEPYRKRGQEFLEDLFQKKYDAAFALLDTEAKKEMSADRLEALAAGVTAKMGPLKSVDYKSESSNSAKGYALVEVYHVTYDKGEADSAVEFRFSNLAGRISAYKPDIAKKPSQ